MHEKLWFHISRVYFSNNFEHFKHEFFVAIFFTLVCMSNTSIGYQLFTFTDTYSTSVHRYRAKGRYENTKEEQVVMVGVICPPGSNRVI